MENKKTSLFEKDNLLWMLIGVVVIVIGLFLMSGGKSEDPNVFDEKVIYSTTRITIAPLLIMVGLLIEVYAIMKKGKSNS
ncbi:MAG: DUF3098 domain-containing protein [bacterium]|jgi:hypothetical protein